MSASDIIEHGARGVRGVRHVPDASGHAPDQITVNGAKQEVTFQGRFARAFDHAEYPGDLCSRKIGIEEQSGPLRHRRLQPFAFELCAKLRCPPVLPDDGPVNGLSVALVPDNCGFALIGDPDAGDVIEWHTAFLDAGPAGVDGCPPEVFHFVFYPAGRGEMLVKFLLRLTDNGHVGIKQNCPAGRCSLINGENMGHHWSFDDVFARLPVSAGICNVSRPARSLYQTLTRVI